MKNMNKLLAIILIIFLSSCSLMKNQKLTVEEIWQKYIDTIGEKEVIENIRTYSTTIVSESESHIYKNRIHIKFPDKVSFEVKRDNFTELIAILNGTRGIIISQTDTTDMSSEEIIEFKEIALIFPEIYINRLNYKMELQNDTIIDGRKLYNIKLKNNTKILNYFINKKDFTFFCTISIGEKFEVVETRIVDGVLLIESAKTTTGTNTSISKYTELKLNEEINDSIFELK